MTLTIVGIDVAKASLQVCLLCKEEDSEESREEQFALENTPKGIRKLLRHLARLEVSRVAVEATGGYEWALLVALVEAGIPACRINPARIRDFAKAMGNRAKTDPIDARVIAEFAAVAAPRELHKVSPQEQRLRELVVRRQQLVEMRTAEKNRKGTVQEKIIVRQIDKQVKALGKQIGVIEKAMEQVIAEDEELAEKVALLVTIPGVARLTAISVLALIPELGTLNRKEAAALAGVAPMNRDSGQYRGYRSTKGGGRRMVKAVLHMPTLGAARRYNKPLMRFYEGLKARGKQTLVTLTACTRKLIVLMNAILKSGTPYDETLDRTAREEVAGVR